MHKATRTGSILSSVVSTCRPAQLVLHILVSHKAKFSKAEMDNRAFLWRPYWCSHTTENVCIRKELISQRREISLFRKINGRVMSCENGLLVLGLLSIWCWHGKLLCHLQGFVKNFKLFPTKEYMTKCLCWNCITKKNIIMADLQNTTYSGCLKLHLVSSGSSWYFGFWRKESEVLVLSLESETSQSHNNN